MPKARDFMTKDPTVCKHKDTAMNAVKIMQQEDVGVVPIVNENQECVGIITDRDIVLKVVANNKTPDQVRLQEIMSTDLLTVHPDDDMETVIMQMEQGKVRRIPVVDNNRRPIGIISERNLAMENPQKVAEMTQAVLK